MDKHGELRLSQVRLTEAEAPDGRQAERRIVSETLVCWYWPIGLGEAEFDIPVPYERRGEAEDVLAFAREVSSPATTEWVKVFASTELDVRYRWSRES